MTKTFNGFLNNARSTSVLKQQGWSLVVEDVMDDLPTQTFLLKVCDPVADLTESELKQILENWVNDDAGGLFYLEYPENFRTSDISQRLLEVGSAVHHNRKFILAKHFCGKTI